MKFSTLQENLAKGIQTVSKALPTKGSLPILSNVLITAKDGKITLSTTNLETAIITNIGATIDEEGSITIPAKLLKEFVGTLSSGTVKAELKGQTLHLAANKTKSRFNGIGSQDYPQLPGVPKDADLMEITPADLTDAASVVAFAAGTDSSRPVFTGVLLIHKGSKLTIVATDGCRLSEKTIKVSGKAKKEFSTIIPAKTFMEVSRIFGAAEEPIKLVLNESENLTLFYTDDTMVATRILEGQYPDYKKIIPTETTMKATFPSEEFLQAVKLTNIFAKEANNPIKVRFDPAGEIRIVSLKEETGEHESILEAEVEGELMEIAFTSRYLLDFLSNIKSERIVVETGGNITPCLLKPQGHEEFLHLIMPVQL